MKKYAISFGAVLIASAFGFANLAVAGQSANYMTFKTKKHAGLKCGWHNSGRSHWIRIKGKGKWQFKDYLVKCTAATMTIKYNGWAKK